MRNLEIFDSTLRDGAQARNISFTVEDKLNIVRALDALGVRYIEAGNPTSNPKDLEFFTRAALLHLQNAELVAFGSTRHRERTPQDDPLLQRLLGAGTGTVAIFGKSSELHAREVLGVSLEENLHMIEETVRYCVQNGKQVIFDGEHFFDGYKQNPDYAMRTLQAAASAGAMRLVLCDTNGGCFPDEIAEITGKAVARFGGMVGIHCHDDMGCAVAGSLMAVGAGAVQVQGTFIGFGERCGNANLSAVIPSLQLKRGYACIPEGQLCELTATARYVAEVANIVLPAQLPYVGASAFAHKGGMHIDGVTKLRSSFEHVDPASVGNERDLLLSEMSGRTSLLHKIRAFAPGLRKDSAQVAQLMDILKGLEFEGYQFESASASFELVVLRHLELFSSPYRVELFRIVGEQADKQESKLSSAIVKVQVGERSEITAAEGQGPVNALDKALRKALEVFYPEIRDIRLVDYKVRVMEPQRATAAKVRVFIETTDGAASWTTVGVSTDIINASFKALTESMDYKLYRSAKGL